MNLPPALLSILQSHISETVGTSSSSGSRTVVSALTQRAKLLQEENDQLYELLHLGETGKLKEEVRNLRRVVARLEQALTGVSNSFASDELLAETIGLKESHGAISSLSYV